MGFGGISIWQLLIVLAIVLLLFGTKRLRNLGGDLGSAFKGFKKAMGDEGKSEPEKMEQADEKTIEGEATKEEGETTKDKGKQD